MLKKEENLQKMKKHKFQILNLFIFFEKQLSNKLGGAWHANFELDNFVKKQHI